MRYFALYYPRTDDMSTPDISQPPFMLFHEDAFSRAAVESYRDQFCTTAVIVPVDAEVAGGDLASPTDHASAAQGTPTADTTSATERGRPVNHPRLKTVGLFLKPQGWKP